MTDVGSGSGGGVGGGEGEVSDSHRSIITGSNNNLSNHGDDFLRSISRIAVSQICESVGYHAFETSALSILSDLSLRYITEAGRRSTSHAELSNRTECCAFDVIRGLEDLGFNQGFPGAADVGKCVGRSGVVTEIGRFVGEMGEVPFLYLIPRVPVVKECRLPPSWDAIGVECEDDHVPSWLPAYPDPSTYRETGSGGNQIEEERLMSVNVEQGKAAMRHRENGMTEDDLKIRGADEMNPFLAPPFQYGEKEVSVVVFPSRLSEEGFATNSDPLAVCEAGKGSVTGSEDGKKVVSGSEKRPRVQFKLSSSRKFFPTRMSDVGVQKSVFYETDDDMDTDERLPKVRVEEPADIPSELAPL